MAAVAGLAACASFHSDASMITYDELIAVPAPHAGKRVPYGPGALHFGDLWLPRDASASSRTTVVYIHGGCWQAEYSLDHASYVAAAFADAGYVAWLPEYRRLGDDGGGWPGTFDDVGAAVDFVRVLAATESRIDLSRVILAGHSAGGQLALWAASRRESTALRAAGVVTLAGITDLAQYGAIPGSCNASVTPLLGGPPSEFPERYRAVSPAERVPVGVPIVLVHGERDPIVPIAQARDFAERAQAAGDAVDVTLITNAGHFDLIAPQTAAWPLEIGRAHV